MFLECVIRGDQTVIFQAVVSRALASDKYSMRAVGCDPNVYYYAPAVGLTVYGSRCCLSTLPHSLTVERPTSVVYSVVQVQTPRGRPQVRTTGPLANQLRA